MSGVSSVSSLMEFKNNVYVDGGELVVVVGGPLGIITGNYGNV